MSTFIYSRYPKVLMHHLTVFNVNLSKQVNILIYKKIIDRILWKNERLSEIRTYNVKLRRVMCTTLKYFNRVLMYFIYSILLLYTEKKMIIKH